MGVLKNGVGRPSNEVIRKRNVFKIIGFLIIVVFVFAGGYFFNAKIGNTISSKSIKKLSDEEARALTEDYLISEYTELSQSLDEYMNSDLYKTMIALSNTQGTAYDLCSSYNDKVTCKDGKLILNDGSVGQSLSIVIGNYEAKKTIKRMFKNYKYLDNVPVIQSVYPTQKFNLDVSSGYDLVSLYNNQESYREVPYNVQKVISATKEGNTIHVDYAFAEIKTDNNEDFYIVGKDNEKIYFDYISTVDESDNNSKILDKNINKINHYDIIFKKTDYGYVYDRIVKK